MGIKAGIHVNGIEFPVVSIGQARLRVNLMPQHTHEHLDKFIDVFEKCLVQSEKILDDALAKLEEEQKNESAKL